MKGYFTTHAVADYLIALQEFFPDMVCPVISIDDGHAQCNYAFYSINDEGGLCVVEGAIPSIGRSGRHVSGAMGGAVGLYGCVESGAEYTISPYVAAPEDTRSKEYCTTDLNRFLIHAVLDHLGLAGHRVAVLTGLPLAQFLDGEDSVNSALIRRKHANVAKPVYIGHQRKPGAQVVHARTYPEAVSGMIDYLMDERGREQVSGDDAIRMAMDIGGKTTDLAIVLPGSLVGAHLTIDAGVHHVKDRLKVLLVRRFGHEPDASMLEYALRNRTISWWGGEEESVEEEVADAISSVMKPILGRVNEFRKDYPSLREIIGFGGGVALMESVIKEAYPSITIVPFGDGANARGQLKYAVCYELDAIAAAIAAAISKPEAELVATEA